MNRPQPSDPRYSSLETLFGHLTARVQAVDKDISRALFEYDRQIHRERLDELSADRQTVADYLNAIEHEQPLPGPWPIELRTSDLAVRAAVFTFGRRPVFHVPDALPPNYIPRPELLTEVRQALLADRDTLVLTSAIKMDALHGMGGIGKSVMARALCDDPEVQAAFPDGILWTRVGQTPDVIPRLREWIDALGGSISETAPTVDRLKAILTDLLGERACLLIADDVWKKTHAEVFRVSGPKCRLLLTTRDAALAEETGADVHAVPIMAEAEAIALLEEWADGKLSDIAAELKTKIVRRLGRLPLAIKLAGAQLRHQDAEQWLATFDARKLKMRRVENIHDSLADTFALSLDDLDPADRRLYVALAIFREDESTPIVGIANLWSGLARRGANETRELLDDLAARALLQHSQVDGDAVILHDLLRDFIDVELGDYGRVAAHRSLLDAYRVTQQGVGWHTAPDDGYLYDHLTYHLDKLADHVPEVEDELHNLFANQSWMLARIPQSGYLYDGYLADLNTVWRRAHIAAHIQIDADQKPSAVVDCVRFALIRSSVNSLAGNYDAALVAAAIETGLWPIERGLSVARLIPDPLHRANMFAIILGEIRPDSGQHGQVQREALAAVQAIRNDDARAQAQAALLPQLTGNARDEVLREELVAAHTISNAVGRVQALTVLAAQLAGEDRSDVLNEALKSARAITDKKARALALIDMAPLLGGQAKESALSEALMAAQAISDGWARANTLAVLAGQSLGLDREAALATGLATARSISHEPSRVAALAALAPQLTCEDRESVVLEGLVVAQAISDMWTRATAVAALIPHLTGPTREASLRDGLAAAQAVTYQRDRAYALAKLIPYVTHSDRAIALREGLAAARQIDDERDRANLLAALAPELTVELLQQGFEAAQLIRDEKGRTQVLAAMAPRLTESLLQKGLAGARIIDDLRTREYALSALASQFTGESVREGLVVAKAITCEIYRAQVLLGLAPQLTGDSVQEVLTMAQAIHRYEDRAMVLAALVPHLTGKKRQEVLTDSLETTRRIQDTRFCAQVLAALVPHLSGEVRRRTLKDALGAAQAMDAGPDRALVLAALAPHLTTEDREDALRIELELTRDIYFDWKRAQVLTALAPHLTKYRLVDGLLSAMAIQDDIARGQALEALTPHLTDDVLQQVLEISDLLTRVRTIALLAPYLTSEDREMALWKALTAVHRIYWEDVRAEALITLAPHIVIHQQDEALSATMAIQDAETQVRVLTAVAPHLTARVAEVALRQALAVTKEIDDEQARAYALTSLAPQLTGDLLCEGLAVAQQIKDDPTRMEVVLAMESPMIDEADQSEATLFLPHQSANTSDICHSIIHHLENYLVSQQRIAVLEYCADQRYFAPSVLSLDILSAIAFSIIEICQEWEWL